MPQGNYLPLRQGPLADYTKNLARVIGADPAAFGVSADRSTAYTALQNDYATKLSLAIEPETRTAASIERKDLAKKSLIKETRSLVRQVQEFPSLTDDQRRDLDIPIRDTEPTPINTPTEMPTLEVRSMTSHKADLLILNSENKRRKAPGARAAWLYTHTYDPAGENPPTNLKQWRFEGESTRSNPQINFPEEIAPGTAVWVTALWVSPTGKPGPACAPVKTHINFQGLSQAA